MGLYRMEAEDWDFIVLQITLPSKTYLTHLYQFKVNEGTVSI